MLTHAITDHRAWTARRVDSSSSWYYPLSPRCLAALDEMIHDARRRVLPITSLVVSDACRRACAETLAPVLQALETGRGFAIIDGVPLERYSNEEAQMMYWLIGQILGQPFEQNVQGTLLYDVRDYGQDVAKGARFSVTNSESSFHTDNSFGLEVLDYVGLLCLNTAKAGGGNQLVSAFAAHNELLAHHRDVLEILYKPFHVDRRGGTRPGEAPTVQVPIMQWDGREVLCRYLRYWIEVGQQKADAPLTPKQVEALNVFDDVMKRPELMVQFDLRRGQILMVNNRWLLHNRTAFEDYTEPERRRHLVRLWLKSSPEALRMAG